MKRILLVLFLSTLSHLGWSQKTCWPVVGIHKNLSLQQHTFRASVSPTMGIQSRKYEVSVGPVLQIRNFPSAEEKPDLTGIQSIFRLNLQKKEMGHFQWFLSFSSRLQSFKEEWVSNYWNETLHKYQDVKMENREKLWENYAGIGLARPVYQKLELQAKVSAGYFLSIIKPRRTAALPFSEEYDFRFYREHGPAFSFGIGVNYLLK